METLKNRFRLYRRTNGTFYWQDNESCRQGSLRTKDRVEAEKLLHAKNEAYRVPSINLKMAQAYLVVHNPKMLTRTWTDVMEQMCRRGKPSSQLRCRRVFRSDHFDSIRDKVLVQTTADDLLTILNTSGNSISHYLRRLHNFALDLHWLPWPALPKAGWPRIKTKKFRAITAEEHERIIASELNAEKRAYYEFLWHTGAAQSDGAEMTAEKFNWNDKLLVYQRMKMEGLGGQASLNIGPRFQALLGSLPAQGSLFPTIRTAGANARATEFRRRCKIAKVSGVSLHSYRYAWAHRARQAGVSLREAQAALGHSSRAVHEAYAGNDPIVGRSLEEYEEARAAKIIPMPSLLPLSAPQPDSLPIIESNA